MTTTTNKGINVFAYNPKPKVDPKQILGELKFNYTIIIVGH